MNPVGFVNSGTGTVLPAAKRSIALLTSTAPSLSVPRAINAPSLLPMPALSQDALRAYGENSAGKALGKVIVLFRSDLRLHDHPALNHAVEEATTVLPVFCFDPRHFGLNMYGMHRTGKYRANFLRQSVHKLRKALKALGSDLIVRFGHPETEVPELCKSTGAKHVFLHKEITSEERTVEKNLATSLKQVGADMKLFWANTLYDEEDLPFSIDRAPNDYTKFRETLEDDTPVRDPLPAPESLSSLPKGIENGKIPTLRELGLEEMTAETTSSFSGVGSVTGGEDEALMRVKSFVEDRQLRVGEYDDKDSEQGGIPLLGSELSVRVSPWLALGCISPRRILAEFKQAAPRPELAFASYTYHELVWRDYFRMLTFKYSLPATNKNAVEARAVSIA